MGSIVFICKDRIDWQLPMNERDYVTCLACGRSFQVKLILDVEVECKCPACDHVTVVTITDQIEKVAA